MEAFSRQRSVCFSLQATQLVFYIVLINYCIYGHCATIKDDFTIENNQETEHSGSHSVKITRRPTSNNVRLQFAKNSSVSHVEDPGKKVLVSKLKDEPAVTNKTRTRTSSQFKKHKKQNLKNSESMWNAILSKFISNDGTGRGCPACENSGDCDPHLDPNVNISGIPIIQIIIAGLIGAFWAGLFLFILKNFVEDKGSFAVDGYESPAYGAPTHEYGAPSEYAVPSTYNIHRVANLSGRKSPSQTFNIITDWVLNTLDKIGKLYD